MTNPAKEALEETQEWLKQNPKEARKRQERIRNDQAKLNFEADEDLQKILKNSQFFEVVIKEYDKTIVREYENKKTILLIILGGKLTINADATSTNLMVNDDSGAGKDYIVKEILKLLPEDEVIIRKRISEKAFTYWSNEKINPGFTWDGKVFYNEDISNQILNSDVFKVMASSSGISTSSIVVNNFLKNITIHGKPCMVITIASANPNRELLRRFPICNLDLSEEQTKLILKRKAEFHEKGIRPNYDEKIKDAIFCLRRVKVKVPFASKLTEVLCTKNIIIRTCFDRFIDYIKFSTAIHQYQRQTDEEGYVIADEQDYEIGRNAFIKTSTNFLNIPLTKTQQKILAVFKEKQQGGWLSVSDLEPFVTFCSDMTLRAELNKLTEMGFLEKDKAEKENSAKPVMIFRALDLIKLNIPTWKDLQLLTNVKDTKIALITKNAITTKTAIMDKIALNGGAIKGNIAIPRRTQPTEIEIIHLECQKCGLSPCVAWVENKPLCYGCYNDLNSNKGE